MIDNNSNDNADRTDKLIYRLALGVVVIIIGLLLLARQHNIQLDFLYFHNWWALFILIPAVAMSARVVTRVRRLGRFDAEAAGTTIGALSTGLVAILFLADLNFDKWWPVFVVFGGLAILISAFGKDDNK